MAASSTVLIPKPQPLMCSNKTAVRRNDAGWKKEVTRMHRTSFVHPPVKQSTPGSYLPIQLVWGVAQSSLKRASSHVKATVQVLCTCSLLGILITNICHAKEV